MERERARLLDEAAQRIEAARAIEEKLAKLTEYEKIAAELGYELVPSEHSQKSPPTLPIFAALEMVPAATVKAPAIAVNAYANVFNGTFASLTACYQKDPKSTYHGLKHNVRLNYDLTLKRLVADIGNELISSWNADRVQREYDENWAAGGKLHMGHALIAKLRLLCTYGSTVLNDDACTRLSAILGNMRFPIPKPLNEPITAKYAHAIRKKARELGHNSIALAQALQFELRELRQMDVIGEWVPISEPGPPSDITKGDEKWLRGLRWSEIDEDKILRRTLTSGRKNQHRDIEIDLKRHPAVMEELELVPPWKRTGPLVICESTGQPWIGSEFRRKWRQVAEKAGVPKTVKNDSRSGIRETDEREDADAGVFA
jgi:hypothetical protein